MGYIHLRINKIQKTKHITCSRTAMSLTRHRFSKLSWTARTSGLSREYKRDASPLHAGSQGQLADMNDEDPELGEEEDDDEGEDAHEFDGKDTPDPISIIICLLSILNYRLMYVHICIVYIYIYIYIILDVL